MIASIDQRPEAANWQQLPPMAARQPRPRAGQVRLPRRSGCRQPGRWSTLFALFVIVSVSLLLLAEGRAGAQPTRPASSAPSQPDAPPAPPSDASLDGGVPADSAPPPPAESPAALALRKRAAGVRALLDQKLDVGIEPQTLFSVSLGDEDAMRVQVERLRAMLLQIDAAAVGADAGSPDAGLQAARKLKVAAQRLKKPASGLPVPSAAASTTLPDGDAGVPESITDAELVRLDPKLWEAQLSLDRVTLAFLELPKSRRNELLDAHARRQRASAEAEKKRDLTAAEQAVQQADVEQQQALVAARQARTEASRLVAEERARLLGVIKHQAEFEASLAKRELTLAAAKERTLKLEREVREAIGAAQIPGSQLASADNLYLRLRQRLRDARSELSAATSRLGAGHTQAPDPGDNRLQNLPVEIDLAAAKKLRQKAEASAKRLGEAERQLMAREAQQLYYEVEALNGNRLALVPLLSSTERQAIKGFSRSGLDQAAAEIRQVVVVLRYHLVATLEWAAALTDAGSARGRAALDATLLAIRAIPPLLLFFWWRRRSERTLLSLREALSPERQRGVVGAHFGDAPAVRATNLLIRVHHPLEWLLLIAVVTWALPTDIIELLEYTLPYTIFTWTLGGSLVVLVVDFLAGESEGRKRRASRIHTGHLRLRSLGLVGRVVVAFGLILALTSQLVGEGTIYGWVLRLCWFAAIPVVLQLVRWWRVVIFQRLEAKRKKAPLERWVVGHKSGWQSFVAALLGGALLATEGSYRWIRAWISSFNITRRVLAYFFRREINKKADAGSHPMLAPLGTETYVTLSPTTPSQTTVPSVADSHIAEVIERIKAPGGGVFAIVGERGLGKTTVLGRIATEAPNVLLLPCPFGGMEAFSRTFLTALGADAEASLESVAQAYDASARDEVGILIDDAHRLIRPMMGGLKAFDRVLAIARRNSKNVAWVFAFDDVIWRFFERIRGAQPLFDEVIRLKPWQEEAIVKLLLSRSDVAGVDPVFDDLVGDLPSDADELDLQEAHDRTEANYYRLIWDYAGGNPGVALHVWRSLLGVDSHGAHCVKVFRAPNTEPLELLPDPAVFVLRSLVQLERAQPDSISKATGISIAEVEDALRFGIVRGYFRQDEHGYTVHWSWFRVITRFLQRRHLLFAE